MLAGCAMADAPPVAPPDPLDTVWAEQIHNGDLIVAVPGTGAYDNLGQFVDAAVDATHPIPTLDGRVDINPISLEQGLAAAHRAGFSDGELQSGALTFAVWGIGATKATAFTYLSLGGLRVRFEILGGKSICAVGALPQNLLHYTHDNVDADARDLYARIQTFLAQHPAPHVILAAHSWGGAVAEYVTKNLATLHDDLGPLGDSTLAFTVAAGVPAMIVGDSFQGPGYKVVESQHGATELRTTCVEVDRPDDPVHMLQLSYDIEGHQYDIMYGDAFQGSYGITTLELSCHGAPGACPHP